MLNKLKEGFKGNVMTEEPIVCKIPLTFQRLVLNFSPKFRDVFFPKRDVALSSGELSIIINL